MDHDNLPYRISPVGADQEARDLIRSELERDETLIWAGRAGRGIRFTSRDAFMIPFSLMWCGFAIFWETTVILVNAPLLFKLWGIPFVVVGLYIVFGRFLVDARRRAKTFYGVSDRRALIVFAGRTRRVTSLQLANQQLQLEQSARGSGSILFGEQSQQRAVGTFFIAQSNASGFRFEAIDDARAVYRQIVEAQNALGR